MEIRDSRDKNERTSRAYGTEEEFKCCKCAEKLDEGYICENDEKIILCRKCQWKYPMSKCRHDINHEHKHIKFIRADGNKTQQRVA